MTAIGFLAADEDIGKAGPVGLFLILSLLIVVFFLARSMRTHLRRVPAAFPDPSAPQSRTDGAAPIDGDVVGGEVIEGDLLDRPDEPRRRAAGGQDGPESSSPYAG